jgi:hypothetical protein
MLDIWDNNAWMKRAESLTRRSNWYLHGIT